VTQAILHPELSRTLRAMGAPGQASVTEARARSEALALLERDAFVTPAAAYRIVPVAAIRGTAIDLRACVLHASALVEDPGELLAVAAAVCTLGGAAEQRVAQLFAGRRRSLALALDGVANELLFRLADRTVAAIAREARKSGWMPGVEISPGDPGMALEEQAAVLALADAARIGVTLAGAASLSPAKSLSVVVALGHALRPRVLAQRCDACPSRNRCRVK